jgi:hypothetical protein
MDQDTELLLWDYIDGRCDAATKNHVASMIATDEDWKRLYGELMALHLNALADMDSEQPSLWFTKNVMEAVAHTRIAHANTWYLRVIKAASCFFGLAMLVILVYALVSAGSQPQGNGSTDIWGSTFTNFSSLTGSGFIRAGIGVNVVMGLLLLDAVLRARRKSEWRPF